MTPVEKKMAAAMEQFLGTPVDSFTWRIRQHDGQVAHFHIEDAQRLTFGPSLALELGESTTIGAICKFVSLSIEAQTRQGDTPPASLKGAGAGSFEDLLMKEAGRLEAQGVLTMGRYPVASVMMTGSKFPLQVPSLPDFEGVFSDGRQFIIEAKVCSQGAFEIVKDKLKPKQVRHLLTRARFGVSGWLMIHFNAREGKTFYDPPFTVGLRVLPESMGGLSVWDAFVDQPKGAYTGSIDRTAARAFGTVMEWHTPKQCRSPRPNLEKFFEAALAPGLEAPL
jgi:hypothetical protein